jgi:hypothetical protein
MDASHFDAWTKIMTEELGSRRAALRLLAGGALGGLLAHLRRTEVAADCGTAGNRCCKGGCVGGAVCNAQGYCKCKRGRRACDGECIPKKQCCFSDPVPLCRDCGEPRCVNGQWRCERTGKPCGRGCCRRSETCCPQRSGPPVCRRAVLCGPCQFPCGEKCCHYASFDSCCIDKDGKFHCSTRGASC